jgi:hypothetical protein
MGVAQCVAEKPQHYTRRKKQGLVGCLSMATPKPFVQVACLASQVIVEPDGSATLVRIADTFTVDVPRDLPADFKPSAVLDIYIALKSGDVPPGKFNVELLMRPPNKPPKAYGPREILLEGGIHGAAMQVKLHVVGLEFDETYWIDLLWDTKKEVITSIPFRFKRAEPSIEQIG